ncbi:hypothetical protein VTK26DRAFT_2610 [Humicola hyalothermophila]
MEPHVNTRYLCCIAQSSLPAPSHRHSTESCTPPVQPTPPSPRQSRPRSCPAPRSSASSETPTTSRRHL